MKPSERRAMREQKAKEKEQTKSSKNENEQNKSEESTKSEQARILEDNASEKANGKRRESLWQNYPKLITFIICILVFLILFGPYNISRIADMIEEKKNEVDDKTKISMQTVYLLSDMGVEVDWIHFEKYEYTDISYEIDGKKYIKREYPVGDTGYIIWIGGESTDKAPDYVYLIDFEGTGEVIDIRKEDAEAFVQKTMEQREEN